MKNIMVLGSGSIILALYKKDPQLFSKLPLNSPNHIQDTLKFALEATDQVVEPIGLWRPTEAEKTKLLLTPNPGWKAPRIYPYIHKCKIKRLKHIQKLGIHLQSNSRGHTVVKKHPNRVFFDQNVSP